MPPKAKITKEMILDTALSIVQEEGAEKITARSISERLGCSTQPVLYYFSTVEEIKKLVYKKADEYHSAYLMSMEKDYGDPLMAIGMNYIRFAIEERNLFRFLFQSNEFSGAGMPELVELEEFQPVFTALQQELEVSAEEARTIFSTLFIFVHGYASLYANNNMVYDEENAAKALDRVFFGAVCAVKEM